MSRRETLLKPIASSEVEVEVHAEDEDDMQSLGSLLDEHLSYPSSPIPQSPDLQEAMSPGLSKPGTSFSRVLSPDLFTGGEDVDTQLKPTEASQDASVSVAEASNVHLPCASAEARTPIISQLMSMMQGMKKQINELKQKEQSASVSTPEASSYKSPSVFRHLSSNASDISH